MEKKIQAEGECKGLRESKVIKACSFFLIFITIFEKRSKLEVSEMGKEAN